MSDAQRGIFGIDLGTTYSVVGYIDDTGRSSVTRNSAGDNTTPSVVYFENEGNVVVGRVAKETAGLYPDQVVSLIKREMGDREYRRTFFGVEHTPPSISATDPDRPGQGRQSADSAKGDRRRDHSPGLLRAAGEGRYPAGRRDRRPERHRDRA